MSKTIFLYFALFLIGFSMLAQTGKP